MTQKTIKVLPKKEWLKQDFDTGDLPKRKVCAYARVSTDLEDQKNSFNAQLEEYQSRIAKNPDWEFVRLYSDEGISGTSLKNRKGFQEMIGDALSGKIDLILTKSISRFARNTVDCLQTVRDLRAKNVEVYFDKENISTTDPKIEMMLTIFASMAQEESKSISENVKWGIRKRMAKGQVAIQTRTLLGYDKDENGNLVINQKEAEIVKKIFNLYVAGLSLVEIEKIMVEDGIPCKTPTGRWTVGYLARLIGNEKYIGDLLLQKTVVVDFLTHKSVKNNGIEESYYIENHHPAIIDKNTFNYVQALKDGKLRFRELYENYNRLDILCGLVYCESCLRKMFKVSQHSGTKYQRFVYTCKNQYKTDRGYVECHMPNTTDYLCLKEALNKVFCKYYEPPIGMRDILLGEYEIAQKTINTYTKNNILRTEITALKKEADELVKQQIEDTENLSLEKEFNEKKALLRSKTRELNEANDQFAEIMMINKKRDAVKNYINNKYVSPILVKEVIKKILIRSSGRALFILSDDDFTLSRSKVNRLLLEPVIESDRVELNDRILDYDVIRIKSEDYNENPS